VVVGTERVVTVPAITSWKAPEKIVVRKFAVTYDNFRGGDSWKKCCEKVWEWNPGGKLRTGAEVRKGTF